MQKRMRRRIAVPLCLWLLLCGRQAPAQPGHEDALRRDLGVARTRVYPALVNIAVVFRYFAEGRTQRAPAGGSGVIISPDGYVITNFHVAGHTTRITCTLGTGEALDASVVADDPLTDISILKLRLDRRADPKSPLPYASLGDSDALRVGDFVLAMGNPLMLSSSMTLGIVSNTKRVFTDFTGTSLEDMELDEGERTGLFTRWIQHDALILPGNSGGPLVNLKGQVVGINELGGNGIGFAIPSNLVSRVFQEVRRYGHVRRGWLDLSVLPVHKIGRSTGTLVSAVIPNTPAAKAGIQPGDILLTLNGAPVNTEFFEQIPLFYQQVANLPIGQPARIKLLRHDAVMTLTAAVTPMEPSLGDEEEWRDLGLTARAMTRQMALVRHLPDSQGVMVTGVRPGYPCEAAQPKLLPGDIIRTIDGKPISDLAALRRALRPTGETQEIVVGFRRNDASQITVVKKTGPKPSEEGGELAHAWLGLRTQVVTPDIAKALGLPAPDTKGFLITQVFPYTEAFRAGLQTGDVIVALNGNALDASRPQDAEDLKHAVEELTAGEKATLTLLRGHERREIAVKLEPTPMEADQSRTLRQKEFEFVVRQITLLDKIEHHWPSEQTGIIVADTTQGGWANIAGLHPDDLIVSINDRPAPDLDAFKQVMQNLLARRPKVIRIFVRRDYSTHFVFIEPDWSRLGVSQ
jgi:serine protease Do